MSKSEARRVLIHHNKWRRGNATPMGVLSNHFADLGRAIDTAITALAPVKREKK